MRYISRISFYIYLRYVTGIYDSAGNLYVDSEGNPKKYDYRQEEDPETHEPTNIGVQAYYNQNHKFQYFTDEFLTYLSGDEFTSLTTDEAQRIKLITYYTFNSIPLQENWKVLISYRIYAN